MDKTRTLLGESRKNQIRLLSLNIIQSKNGLKAVGFLLLFVFSFRVPLSVYFQYTDKYADNPTTGIRVGCQKKPHLSEKNKGKHGSDFLPAKRFAMWALLEGERTASLQSKHILFFGCFTSRKRKGEAKTRMSKKRPEGKSVLRA